MKKKKILYISGTRADYGLMKSVLKNINDHPFLELEVAVSGMHLMKEFGYTINEIKKDGYKIFVIDAIYEGDDKAFMSYFIGEFIQKLTMKVLEIRPDFIMLLGDRGEMLAGAVVGSYLSIPVIHLHGGEITSTVDDISRHTITKLSHIHFPATEKSAERIIKMGEELWRVNVVGAPALDTILNREFLSKEEVCKKLNIRFDKPILLVIQHSVSNEIKDTEKQIIETMEAIRNLEEQTIIIYPCADAGGRKIIKVIEKYRDYPFIKIYKSFNYNFYLSLMKNIDVLIGNSSSGIIEAPSFSLPTVNIGVRQEGRERASNVINVGHDKVEIINAIKKALYDKDFKIRVRRSENPYGDGKTGKRVAENLSKIEINNKLLQKRLIY